MDAKAVVITQDAETRKAIEVYFTKRGEEVITANGLVSARALIKEGKPKFIFVDLHLSNNEWLDIIDFAKKEVRGIGIIATTKSPNVHKELLAKQHGAKIFLRHPFTPAWIDKAIGNLSIPNHRTLGKSSQNLLLPKVKVPMRVKITMPFLVLAILFALASAALVSRYVFDSFKERFLVQLIDTGSLASDWMVQEENRLLETLRLVANVQGLAEGISNSDFEILYNLVYPIAINSKKEAVEVIDLRGQSLLSIYQKAENDWEYLANQSNYQFSKLEFVQKVINGIQDEYGDKFIGIALVDNKQYLFTAGPVYSDDNNLSGVVLVGTSLQSLVNRIRQDTLAHVSLYGLSGNILASTLLDPSGDDSISLDLAGRVLTFQDEESSLREMTIASATYTEILAPWEVRNGSDIGVLGTSLAQNFFTNTNLFTRYQIFAIVLFVVLGVVLIGLILAHQITSPLSQIVRAAFEIARGNLEIKVTSRSNDETMVLAHAFNYMVSGLQEGFIYRDLLGRTVSPEVREELRQSFASGNLKLEGQNALATVLMSDVRGFTTLSEKEEPTTILKWLNEYYADIVPVITSYGGVVDKYEGDSMLAFFGILPRPLNEKESAYKACLAALDMLTIIEKINYRRAERGEPPFLTGIGVNTGSLIAGGLGTADRMNYTVIGDTVNTTQRIQSISNEFGASGVVVSETTLLALSDHRDKFDFTPLGEYFFKGKREAIWLYRLYTPGSKPEMLNEVISESWDQGR